jgi:tetratricopeptide (TPR) repeat protein
VRSLLLLAFGLFLTTAILAQGETDQQLAQYYYANAEFAKARTYYEKIYDKEPSKFNFNRLYECLLQEKELKEAEKLIKRQISANRSEQEYVVILAQFYEDNQEAEKALKLYDNLIEELPADPSRVIGLYNAFRSKGKNDLALRALEKGRKLLKDGYPLNFQFAELYGASGQQDKMITEYLDLLDQNPGYSSSIQTVLSRQIDFGQEDSKDYTLLKSALLERIQKKPGETAYSEMLIWLFIQKKNFSAALTQTEALDRKLGEQGRSVMELGKMCVENQSYDIARQAFKYVRELGEDKMYFYQAESALLNTRFLEITTNRDYSQTELDAAIGEYQTTLSRLGKRKTSIPVILELAHIEAFYASRATEAITQLTEALNIPGLTDIQKAELKMKLADIHVLDGDIWEASLLYMQVEADFKFEPIGHEAKFKNARIFYYDGEFDFAQSQLSVLKESTSKLIANDALQLSLLITDNFGLDSNYAVMTWFAKADLLIEQHRYEEAYQLFDSIHTQFPYHSLSDEILFKKARISEDQGDWTGAVPFLEELLKYHGEDILADDALFHLGNIFENHLANTEKAIEYYKIILFDFKGSLYAIEARKRLRALRGDKLEDEDLQ